MMADAKTYRKRNRRGRRPVEAEDALQPEADRRTTVTHQRWEWLTFPVFFAFVCGGFTILLIAPETNTNLYTVLFLTFMAGFVYGLLHMAVRWWLLRRRQG